MSQSTPETQNSSQAKPQTPPPTEHHKPVIPIGTLMVIGFLMLNIIFFWMLVLGVQQGRA